MPDSLKELLTYNSAVHATSGAVGAVTSILIFFPLNAIRLQLQLDDSLRDDSVLRVGSVIAKRDGLGALYRGWSGTSACVGASAFIYFYAYNALKALYRIRARVAADRPMTPTMNLAIATLAGVINVLATAPLWTVSTRLATRRTKDGMEVESFARCLANVVREEGAKSLWKDLAPSLLLVSNPAIQFVTYERLRILAARLARQRGHKITPLEFFAIGAVAKANATLWTYPLQVVQTRLRVNAKEAAAEGDAGDGRKLVAYGGAVDCLVKVWVKDGIAGFYKGMCAKLWQTVLTSAFQFLTYEQLSALVFVALGSDPEVLGR